MDLDDAQLLQAYVRQRSEAAFRELVRRHLPLVQGVARRQVGIDAHLADDVAQRVFVALARKAATLAGPAALVGWLHKATRLEAIRVARTEARRRAREGKANEMNENPTSDTSWEQLKPVLDEALARLGDGERQALLLRFFSGQSFAEVGRALHIGEEAARKRVERAVEKLQQMLGRRGIVSTSTALGLALGAHAAPAVSPDAVAAMAASAWSQSAAGGSAAVGTGIFMGSTKMTVAAAGVALLLAGAVAMGDVSQVREAEAAHATAEGQRTTAMQQLALARRNLATLEQERTTADAREREIVRTSLNPVRPYLSDPAYRALARAQSQARQHLEFQRLYRQLDLSPAQVVRFEEIMARQNEANLDGQIAQDLGRDPQTIYRESGPEWNQAMRELLGHEGKQVLEDYLRSQSIRGFVDSIAAQSYETAEPFTPEQSDRLARLALEHDPMYQAGRGTDPAKVNWNDVWEPASQFLTPAQLITFETMVEVWALKKRMSILSK